MTAPRCIGGDPLCPCHDGDACHYRAAAGTPAWPTAAARDPLAEALRDYWPAPANQDDPAHFRAILARHGLAVVPLGLWQTLHNGLNCVIHEEDNDPPDWRNAVRIARNTLAEARAMVAAASGEAQETPRDA